MPWQSWLKEGEVSLDSAVNRGKTSSGRLGGGNREGAEPASEQPAPALGWTGQANTPGSMPGAPAAPLHLLPLDGSCSPRHLLPSPPLRQLVTSRRPSAQPPCSDPQHTPTQLPEQQQLLLLLSSSSTPPPPAAAHPLARLLQSLAGREAGALPACSGRKPEPEPVPEPPVTPCCSQRARASPLRATPAAPRHRSPCLWGSD